MKAIKARLSKFSTVDEYIIGWGSYYFSGGLLLPTKKVQPTGTTVSLHIQISTGETVLRGEGVVEEVRTNSSGQPVGIVIRFTKLDASSKELVRQILQSKKQTKRVESEEEKDGGASGLTDQATGENLGSNEIGAIADELEQTFDSIFSGAYAAPDSGSQSGLGDAKTTTTEESAGHHGPESLVETDENAAQGSDQDQPSAGENQFEVSGFMDEGETTEVGAQNAPVGTGALDAESAQPPPTPPITRLPQSPPHELQPENRVSSFIDEVTGGSAAIEGALLTHEEAESPKVTSLVDAAERAKAATTEGEVAFDDMLASASMSLPAANSRPRLDLPVRTRKKGLFERFFSWVKNLFG